MPSFQCRLRERGYPSPFFLPQVFWLEEGVNGIINKRDYWEEVVFGNERAGDRERSIGPGGLVGQAPHLAGTSLGGSLWWFSLREAGVQRADGSGSSLVPLSRRPAPGNYLAGGIYHSLSLQPHFSQ